MAVASNPGAPQDLLERLFEDDDCWDAVIMNPAASFDLLEGLGKVDEEQASAKADERDGDGREQERDVVDWDVIPF